MATIGANVDLVYEALDHASATHSHELANSRTNVLRFHHYIFVKQQRQIRSWLKIKLTIGKKECHFGCQNEIDTYSTGNRAYSCVRDARGYRCPLLLQPFF